MWLLLRDQFERHVWKTVVVALGLVTVVLLTLIVPLAAGRDASDAPQIARVFFYWGLFWCGYVGLILPMSDRRGLRAMRALPVTSRQLAWGWWLGATVPSVLMGGLAYAALESTVAVVGLAWPRMTPGALTAPGAVAFALLWGCSLAGATWSPVLRLIARDPRFAAGGSVGVFLVVGLSLVWPAIFRWADVPAGGPATYQTALLVAAVGLAGVSFVVSPRMVVPASEVRRARRSIRTTERADDRMARSTRWTASAEVLKVSATTVAVTTGGLLMVLAAPLGDLPFSVRHSFMLIIVYVVPTIWTSSWLSASRAFRCLPLSSNRLASLPVLHAILICLMGAIAVALLMMLTDYPTARFTPLLWWLLLCPGLLSLLNSVALHMGPARSTAGALGLWSALVTVGSVTPFAQAPGPFWPAALAGLVATLLGFLGFRRGLMHGSMAYRAARSRA